MSTSTHMVTGVDFVMISTSDIDRARQFYGEVLGLEASKQWGEMPAFEFETGSLTLAVADVSAFGQEHSVNRQPIALQVADAHATRQALEAQGVSFSGDTIDSGVCHMAIFKDPDGNTFCLHHRYAPRST
jgi:predicted enzyme related to lactoylglutathione lyase